MIKEKMVDKDRKNEGEKSEAATLWSNLVALGLLILYIHSWCYSNLLIACGSTYVYMSIYLFIYIQTHDIHILH